MDALGTYRTGRPVAEAVVVLAIAVATVAGALAFQAAGFAPCELCLKERLPYYVGIVLAAVTVAVAWRGSRPMLLASFSALAIVFLFSAAFGTYHAGVEWGFWQGPTDCTGSLSRAATTAGFLDQLRTVKVVRCDAVAIRVLGLSLAGWNAVVSLGACATALVGLGQSFALPRFRA